MLSQGLGERISEELPLPCAQGVRDINFSNDGRRFLSTSYDKVVKLWDTETGQVGALGLLPYGCPVHASKACRMRLGSWIVLGHISST